MPSCSPHCLCPPDDSLTASGRKRMFLWGMGIFLLASVLCAAAPDVTALVAARVLQATGAAIMIPTSLALLLPEFAPNRRRAAIGVWTAGAAMAATLGPVLGGLLVAVSWRWVFLVNVPVGCVTLDRRTDHPARVAGFDSWTATRPARRARCCAWASEHSPLASSRAEPGAG